MLGSAVFGVLLWLRLDFWTNEYLELDKSLDRYLILIYVSLVDGALILIFSLFGLIGGLRTVKWALVVVRLLALVLNVLTKSKSQTKGTMIACTRMQEQEYWNHLHPSVRVCHTFKIRFMDYTFCTAKKPSRFATAA